MHDGKHTITLVDAHPADKHLRENCAMDIAQGTAFLVWHLRLVHYLGDRVQRSCLQGIESAFGILAIHCREETITANVPPRK